MVPLKLWESLIKEVCQAFANILVLGGVKDALRRLLICPSDSTARCRLVPLLSLLEPL